MDKQCNIVSAVLAFHNTCYWLFKQSPLRKLSTAHDVVNLVIRDPVLWILGFLGDVACNDGNCPQRCQLGHWGVCMVDFGGGQFFVCFYTTIMNMNRRLQLQIIIGDHNWLEFLIDNHNWLDVFIDDRNWLEVLIDNSNWFEVLFDNRNWFDV